MGQTLRISNHFSRHLRQTDMWGACRAACKEHVKKQYQQLMHERWNAGCLCTWLLTGYTGGKTHVSQKEKKKKRNIINVTPELQGKNQLHKSCFVQCQNGWVSKTSWGMSRVPCRIPASVQVITFMSKLRGSARQTYFLWKAWEHGHTPSSSRLRNSSKHTAHVCCRVKKRVMENCFMPVYLSMQIFNDPTAIIWNKSANTGRTADITLRVHTEITMHCCPIP